MGTYSVWHLAIAILGWNIYKHYKFLPFMHASKWYVFRPKSFIRNRMVKKRLDFTDLYGTERGFNFFQVNFSSKLRKKPWGIWIRSCVLYKLFRWSTFWSRMSFRQIGFWIILQSENQENSLLWISVKLNSWNIHLVYRMIHYFHEIFFK